jgi:hypothetical protein
MYAYWKCIVNIAYKKFVVITHMNEPSLIKLKAGYIPRAIKDRVKLASWTSVIKGVNMGVQKFNTGQNCNSLL